MTRRCTSEGHDSSDTTGSRRALVTSVMGPYVTFLAQSFATTTDEDQPLPGKDLAQWLLDELRHRGVDADSTPEEEDFGWYARY